MYYNYGSVYGIGDGWYTLWVILMVACFLFASWAQISVSSNFKKYSRVMTRRGLTGAQAAQAVLRANGVSGVQIARITGNLTDNFNPRTNVISLSSQVYGVSSVAAVGVAAHEAGHAVQYAKGYAPIRLRNAIIPLCNFGSSLAWPMLLIGLMLGATSVMGLGVALYALATLFQAVTLPVELNASRRALQALRQEGLLTEDELPMARKTLVAAAMTYVAALATSLVQLLRLVLIYLSRGGGRRRD
ncbi:MAG TPA: zinc metallopeptidase [Candidatus Butyricicoccus stercorigallinarum]|nr:zinc metallopeptidase [Candidatus Butyricicoccus stercorigallinarum]